MIRKSFLLMMVVALMGCATYATGPMFTQPPTPPTGKSIFYLFRAKESVGWTPLVKIDGKPFVHLTSWGYSYAYLAPGVHRITFSGGDSFITEIDVKPGKPVFEKFMCSGMAAVVDIPEDQGMAEIKLYKFVQPISSDF